MRRVVLVLVLSTVALAGDRPRARGKSPGYFAAIAAIESLSGSKKPSVATGTFANGGLENAAELPALGLGYRRAIPSRKAYFGTDAMVFGIMELGAVLQE